MLLALPSAPTVLIFGGNRIIGRTLELLLHSAECNVRFVDECSPARSDLFDGVRLLLLAPELNDECHEVLAALTRNVPSARIPILELINDDREERNETGYFTVPWPCQAEVLKRRIADALLSGSGESEGLPKLSEGKEASVG